jgi:hypothetical protein
VNLAVGDTDWDTASISWGDPAGSTDTLTFPQSQIAHDYGAYSDDSGFPSGYPIQVTVTNSTGPCATPAFASALLPNPDPGGGGGNGTYPLPLIIDGMDAQIDLPVVFNQAMGLVQSQTSRRSPAAAVVVAAVVSKRKSGRSAKTPRRPRPRARSPRRCPPPSSMRPGRTPTSSCGTRR